MRRRRIRPSDISRLSGVSNAVLSSLLHGHTRNPRIDTIEKIAEAVNVPLEVLIGDQDWGDNEALPPGYKRITAVLSNYKAFTVQKWEKAEEPVRKKHSHQPYSHE